MRSAARVYLALALVLTGFFAACVSLIRLQPYDDVALRAFLTAPEGCPTPCFIGIRPGVTTVVQAMEKLTESGWANTIRQDAGTIRWKWSGGQPDWIDLTRDSRMWIRENRVEGIGIATTIRFGQLRLSYGFPNAGRLLQYPDVDLWIGYRALYFEAGFVAEMGITCPAGDYWSQEVWFTFPANLLSFVPEDPLDDVRTPQEITRFCSRWSSR